MLIFITVRINGEDTAVPADTPITYEQAVLLASQQGTPTVTYSWHAPGKSHKQVSGILTPGQSVVPKPFMAFTVGHTAGNA